MVKRRNRTGIGWVVILAMAAMVSGCGDAPTATTPQTAPDSTPTTQAAPSTITQTTEPNPTDPTLTSPSTNDDTPTETTEDPMSDDRQLAEAVEAARSELAADLGVDPSVIEVETAERVTWPDGSMGCPQPGMSYTQALVDGVRVLLKANSVTYHFHGAVGTVPMVCANPRVPPPID